jgi:hypothetical protein
MKYSRGVICVALLGAVVGCSWRRTPVQVVSDSASIMALVGDWEGDYSSTETGRNGTISFHLATAKDTAYGDVFMIPRAEPARVVDQDRVRDAYVRVQGPAEPLKIRFVRLESGHVSGILDEYKDPTCGCTLITTFDGNFRDANTIEGTFTTRGTTAGHQPAAGRWKVTRQRLSRRPN